MIKNVFKIQRLKLERSNLSKQQNESAKMSGNNKSKNNNGIFISEEVKCIFCLKPNENKEQIIILPIFQNEDSTFSLFRSYFQKDCLEIKSKLSNYVNVFITKYIEV